MVAINIEHGNGRPLRDSKSERPHSKSTGRTLSTSSRSAKEFSALIRENLAFSCCYRSIVLGAALLETKPNFVIKQFQ